MCYVCWVEQDEGSVLLIINSKRLVWNHTLRTVYNTITDYVFIMYKNLNNLFSTVLDLFFCFLLKF